jgi:hypothetical protein
MSKNLKECVKILVIGGPICIGYVLLVMALFKDPFLGMAAIFIPWLYLNNKAGI